MLSLALLSFLTASWGVQFSFAKEFDNVKLSNPSVTPAPGSNGFPHQGWITNLDWSIDDTSDIKTGDYFTISMPYVYKVKFNDEETSFKIFLDENTEVFECYAPQQAAFKYDKTLLNCYASVDISTFGSIHGSLTTTLVLSNGGSAYSPEIDNAQYFTTGQNTLYFNDLQATVDVKSRPSTDDFYFSGRSTAYKSLESYFLGFNCPNGHVLGASHEIHYDVGNGGHGIDCSTVQVYQSKNFNDWTFPINYEPLQGSTSCSENLLEVFVDELQPDYRVWVNVLQTLEHETATVRNSLFFDYTCTNTLENSTYKTTTHYEPVYVITEAVYSGVALTTVAPDDKESTVTSTISCSACVSTSVSEPPTVPTTETSLESTSESTFKSTTISTSEFVTQSTTILTSETTVSSSSKSSTEPTNESTFESTTTSTIESKSDSTSASSSEFTTIPTTESTFDFTTESTEQSSYESMVSSSTQFTLETTTESSREFSTSTTLINSETTSSSSYTTITSMTVSTTTLCTECSTEQSNYSESSGLSVTTTPETSQASITSRSSISQITSEITVSSSYTSTTTTTNVETSSSPTETNLSTVTPFAPSTSTLVVNSGTTGPTTEEISPTATFPGTIEPKQSTDIPERPDITTNTPSAYSSVSEHSVSSYPRPSSTSTVVSLITFAGQANGLKSFHFAQGALSMIISFFIL